MNGAEIGMALQTLEWLATSIPKWIESARAKGELTEAQEAEYQARQAAVFKQPYAQPEPVSDATKPNL